MEVNNWITKDEVCECFDVNTPAPLFVIALEHIPSRSREWVEKTEVYQTPM